MSEQKQILETYLKNRFSNKPVLTILRLDKIADGWESDNHVLAVEYGEGHRTQEDWVWRIYTGEGSQETTQTHSNRSNGDLSQAGRGRHQGGGHGS